MKHSTKQTVAILGASDRPERFAYKAFKMLKEYGHIPLPVHPELKTIEGEPVFATLADIPSQGLSDQGGLYQDGQNQIDTLTLYVNPKISDSLQEEILKFKPKRVIFNPGTENDQLDEALKREGIETIRMCTLVLLKSGRF